MSNIEKNIELILKEIREIKSNQDRNERKLHELQKVVDNIKSDIYMDEGFDDNFEFEIICPYCEHEFVIDANENKTEIQCPDCNNTIELDWSGNLDEEEKDEFIGNCAGCPGCGTSNYDEDDDM